MATVCEFELACPACDGPGLYVTEEGARLRAGYTSNLVRHMRRHRPLRILSVAHLEPGRTTRAWRALLHLLRASALTPREAQFDASPVVARALTQRMRQAVPDRSVFAASDISRRAEAQRKAIPPRSWSGYASRVGESDAPAQLDSSPDSLAGLPNFQAVLAAIGDGPPTRGP